MNLNPFSLFKKSNKGFIALLLRERDGMIMYLEANPETQNLETIDSEKFTLTNRWDHLADDVDDALYKVETRTKKTFDDIIFFIYSHLVEPNTHEIKRQHLASIKNLVKNMAWRPLGFIEVNEAYLKYLQVRDANPLSAMLIESDDTALTVFTYQSGELVSQISTQRKRSFISDLLEVLSLAMESVKIPPKIILLPSRDSQEGADLIKHTWDEKFFSSQPSITVVTEEEMMAALISTFASQIAETNAKVNKEQISSQASNDKADERMGFVIGGEIDEGSEMIRPTFTNPFTKVIKSLRNKLPLIKQKVAGMGIFRSRRAIINSSIVVGAVLILAGLTLIEFNLHKAVITLTLPSQKIELTRSFDAQSLGLKRSSQNAKFTASSTATGIKNIGQPAKGTVVVYNSSLGEAKTFTKGTSLTGPGNLTFTLDADVKLASASGDAIDIVSSTAKSSITATAIGPESNLASGTKLSVADESTATVVAKVDGGLTGGTRSQIQVVSEKDIANAEAQIKTKAQVYIQEKVVKSAGSDALILKPLTTVATRSQVENNEVGSEASSVEIKSEVRVGYSYISIKKIKSTVIGVLKSKVQNGLRIADKNLSFNILKVSGGEDDVKLSIKAIAKAVPPFTEQEILKAIVGRTVGALQTLAKERFHAQSVEFVVDHPIAIFKNFLPLLAGNIELLLLYP